MIRYILDTNTLTLLQNGHPKVVQRASAVPPDELAIAIISVEEQLTGWYTQLRRTKTSERLARLYDRLTTTVFTGTSTDRFLFRGGDLPLREPPEAKDQYRQNGLAHCRDHL